MPRDSAAPPPLRVGPRLSFAVVHGLMRRGFAVEPLRLGLDRGPVAVPGVLQISAVAVADARRGLTIRALVDNLFARCS